MTYYDQYDSPMGRLWLLGNGTALTGLHFQEEYEPDGVTAPPHMFDLVKRWLNAFFRGEAGKPDFPMEPEGTEFQKQVWQLLLEIPFGQSRTYGQIAREAARQMGKEKMSAQAVGQAVGRNPIAIIIPCHRILGAGGALTGYASGLERKVWLLRHEGLRE